MRVAAAAGMIAAGVLVCACPPPRPVTSARDGLAASAGPSIDVIARSCARIASCAHRHDAPAFREPGLCVEFWLEHLHDAAEPIPPCLAAAQSCVDVDRCLHGSGDEGAYTFCVAHPETSAACEAGALVTCSKDDAHESHLTPCPAFGATCGETHTAGGLVSHGCLSTAICPPDVTRSRCDGPGAIVSCREQVLEHLTCPPGTRCHVHADDDGEEVATCEAATELACDAIGRRSCRGSTLVRCDAHGHHAREVSVDCAALGLECGEMGGRPGCVVPTLPCEGSAPRCVQGDLVFCAAGRPARVSCTELGLSACEAEGRGPVALCGPGHDP